MEAFKFYRIRFRLYPRLSIFGSQSVIYFFFLQVLSHHEHEVVCLAYARDDRFLVSVGDYRECSVVVWCSRDLVVLTASYARHPVHDVMWDPYTANEFASVGQDGSVLFWLLDETGEKLTLNVRFCHCSV